MEIAEARNYIPAILEVMLPEWIQKDADDAIVGLFCWLEFHRGCWEEYAYVRRALVALVWETKLGITLHPDIRYPYTWKTDGFHYLCETFWTRGPGHPDNGSQRLQDVPEVKKIFETS
jgi:hypothetical protein